MGRKLYVGNMSYEVDSSQLQELFAPHGTVQSAEVIADRETGRSQREPVGDVPRSPIEQRRRCRYDTQLHPILHF